MMRPEPEAAVPFSLEPLTPTIGAVVEGADLAAPLAALCAALKDALLKWKVLFFYDNDINAAQQVAFARHFGELETHPVVPHAPGYPEVAVITHDRDSRGNQNMWHSDVTWRPEPSWGSILRAVEVPAFGGDTLFADMGAAYDGLPQVLKTKIEGRAATHEMGYLRVMMRKEGMSAAEREETLRKYPPFEHPIVRTHPETGRKTLFVNAVFTRRIVGMEPGESSALLNELCARAAIPEYQCRFRWRKNAIAFWDNRATQHYAVSDYWPARRRMERVSIVGDRPY
jgi:taurine dioxygenase